MPRPVSSVLKISDNIPVGHCAISCVCVFWPSSQRCPKFSCAKQSRYIQSVWLLLGVNILPSKITSLLLWFPSSFALPVIWLSPYLLPHLQLISGQTKSFLLWLGLDLLIIHQSRQRNGNFINTAKFLSCVQTDTLSHHETRKIMFWISSDGGYTLGLVTSLGRWGADEERCFGKRSVPAAHWCQCCHFN